MKVTTLNSSVCRIDYVYSADYTPFGEKRFSWYALRDKNREFDVNHVYVIKTEAENEEVLFNTAGSACLICSDGDYTIKTVSDHQAVDYSGYISSNKKHSLGLLNDQSVSAISTMLGGALLVLTENSIAEFGITENVVEKFGDNIYYICHKADGKVFEIYNKELFSQHKLDKLSFVCDESFALKNTFRGLYLHTGEREQSQLITCTKGSVEIYVTDLRKNLKTYLESYSVVLNGSESLYVGKGMAVGALSLSDNTVLNRIMEFPLDRKYISRINISSCGKAEKLNSDDLIMSVLDRKSERAELNDE